MIVTMTHAIMIQLKQQQAAMQTSMYNATNKQTYLQERNTRFPGKQLDSKQQRPEGASVEPRHVHATIANPTSNVSVKIAMMSAHERAAYLRQHPSAATN